MKPTTSSTVGPSMSLSNNKYTDNTHKPLEFLTNRLRETNDKFKKYKESHPDPVISRDDLKEFDEKLEDITSIITRAVDRLSEDISRLCVMMLEEINAKEYCRYCKWNVKRYPHCKKEDYPGLQPHHDAGIHMVYYHSPPQEQTHLCYKMGVKSMHTTDEGISSKPAFMEIEKLCHSVTSCQIQYGGESLGLITYVTNRNAFVAN